ncbi:UDP-N-acetylglucosamine 2-epimerase [Psychromonas sp. PT13]|uniref:UDP-N-acetylglucosamine 2-epimerase n=1 Tax=Psychromonas sp. PT13 TaxID=3439547 RepID=UPI003EBD28B2
MKRYLFFVSHLYSLSIVRPLQKVIRERGDEVAWFLNQKSYGKYLDSTEKQLTTIKEVMAYNPSAVFVASNNVPDFFPGIKVQLFHGFNAQKRDENKGHFRIRGFFDLYCTQGPSTTLPFQELAQKYGFFEVAETGWSKMDPLFDRIIEPKSNDKPTILFSSTFTPALSAAHKIFDKIKTLSQQGKWNWIITFHPKMDQGIVDQFKSIQSDNLTFVETDNILPLLKNADIMLCDSSSIISEFLLQKKAVVTFRNRCPGKHLINVTEIEQIEPALISALSPSSELLDSINDYINFIHPYFDGKSSERIIDATDKLVNKGISHLKKKPLNLFRRIKVRKKFGYYKL